MNTIQIINDEIRHIEKKRTTALARANWLEAIKTEAQIKKLSELRELLIKAVEEPTP
jgi:hypothetical protein